MNQVAQIVFTSTTSNITQTSSSNQTQPKQTTNRLSNNNKIEDRSIPSSVSSKLPKFTKIIKSLVTSTITSNPIQKGQDPSLKRLPKTFKCIGGTTIDLEDYLIMLAKNAEIEEQHIVVTLFLFQKAINKGLRVSGNEAFKLIAVLLFLAFKLACDSDDFWSVENFSNLSGLYPDKLIEMEQFLLLRIFNFEVLPKMSEYHDTKNILDMALESIPENLSM